MAMVMLLTTSSCMFSKKNSNTQIENREEQLMPAEKQIKLFIYQSCSYCHRVIRALRLNGNLEKVLIMDVDIPENMVELKKLTNNNTQCPFIYDEEKNVKMHESQDIINYFSKRFQ